VTALLDQYKALTREEELATHASGDKEALAKSQIALVFSTAHRVCRAVERPWLFDDALSAGLLHLAKAINMYDGSGRLITFVYRGLKNAIFAGVQDCMNTGGVKARVRKYSEWVDTGLECGGLMEGLSTCDNCAVDDKDEIEMLLGLASTTERNRDIFRMHGGGLTAGAVGGQFGITRQRVEAIKSDVIGRIRDNVKFKRREYAH